MNIGNNDLIPDGCNKSYVSGKSSPAFSHAFDAILSTSGVL
jgi:hypothetical protein